MGLCNTVLFQHVASIEDYQRVFEKLNNYELDGRPIHLEQSTSRLRKVPGMADVCFRCGSATHKFVTRNFAD
jgi:RNA recognition motif-containing protein